MATTKTTMTTISTSQAWCSISSCIWVASPCQPARWKSTISTQTILWDYSNNNNTRSTCNAVSLLGSLTSLCRWPRICTTTLSLRHQLCKDNLSSRTSNSTCRWWWWTLRVSSTISTTTQQLATPCLRGLFTLITQFTSKDNNLTIGDE